MSIALVTIAHNEAHRMADHLDRAAMYCDELVVCVQDSDDGTEDVVNDMGATLLRDRCTGYSESSRTLTFAATRADWIMYLDADEHLDAARIPQLADIQASYLLAKLSVGAWTDGIRTDPVNPNGSYHQNRQVRFFRKDRVKWGDTLHSRIEPLFDWMAMPAYQYLSHGDPWVLNVKQGWESAVDEARYERLGA